MDSHKHRLFTAQDCRCLSLALHLDIAPTIPLFLTAVLVCPTPILSRSLLFLAGAKRPLTRVVIIAGSNRRGTPSRTCFWWAFFGCSFKQ